MDQIQCISANRLIVSQNNVRKVVDDKKVEQMMQSIKQVGLLNPLTVMKMENSSDYEIIAGQHRFAALNALGYQTIMCNVIEPKY